MTLTREVRFEPGYDKRTEDKGVHGMMIGFYVKGPEGAVQFTFYTDWIPWNPRPQYSYKYHDLMKAEAGAFHLYPMAVDLGFHSPNPLGYQSDKGPFTDECPILDGMPCWYDGSGLNAEPFMLSLIYDGQETVWQMLEGYYKQVFEDYENSPMHFGELITGVVDALTGGDDDGGGDEAEAEA